MPVIPVPITTPDFPPGSDGICGWNVNPAPICPTWDTLTEAQQDMAMNIATLVMWSATGRRYGPCQITIRPCQSKEWAETYRAYPVWWASQNYGGPMPYLDGGVWRNCGCGAGCCCRVHCEIILPGPVASIVSVVVHGETIPASQYRVDVVEGSYRLVRTSGGCWPTCQDLNENADGLHAFVVTFTRGDPVPQSVLDATGLLSCEFGKQIAGADCGLPPRLQALTRQGVSAEFVVNEIDINTFQTGINLVDW